MVVVEPLWQVGSVGAESSVYPASLGFCVVCGFKLMVCSIKQRPGSAEQTEAVLDQR